MNDHRDEDIDYGQLSDKELIVACKNKDEDAFRELMGRYMAQIYNFARQYARSAEDAEDITQDTFFKAWKNMRKYSDDRHWRPWLYAIARNTALDFIKKKKLMVFSELDNDENDLRFEDTLEDPEPLQNELFESVALTEKLKESFKDLHPDHRSVLTLHYKEDMTFEEVAKIMDKPMNTVKSWHRRALIRLRQALAPHDVAGS